MDDFTIVNLQDLTSVSGLSVDDLLAVGQGSKELKKATIQQLATILDVSASVVIGNKEVEPTEPSFAFAEAGLYPEWGNTEIEGDLGILIFDGTNFSKTEINFIANGIVEEGNPNAVSGGEVFNKTVLNESPRILPIGDEFINMDRPDLDIKNKIIVVDDEMKQVGEITNNEDVLYNTDIDRPDLSLSFVDDDGKEIYTLDIESSSKIDDDEVKRLVNELSLKYTEFGNRSAYVAQPAIPYYDYIAEWDLFISSKINNPQYPDYITKTQMGVSSTESYPIFRYDFKPPRPKGKIVLSFCNHGWEKNPSYSMKGFFDLLINNWADYDMMQWLRWNVHFIVIPVLSPEGYMPSPLSDDPLNRGQRRILETKPFKADWIKNGDSVTLSFNVLDFPDTNGRLDAETYFSGNGVEGKTYVSILNSSSEESLPNEGFEIIKVNSGTSIDVTYIGGSEVSGTCNICVSVDPQRNYDTITPKWVDFKPGATINGLPLSRQDNKGTKPFSLNETIIMKELMEQEENVDLLLDFHSGYVRYYTFNHSLNNDLTPVYLAEELVSDFHSDEYRLLSSEIPALAAYVSQIYNIPAYSPEWDFRNEFNEERATQEFRWFSNLISICSKYYITQKKV